MRQDRRDPPREPFVGVGFGLRWDHLDAVNEALAEGRFEAVPFFEIAPENYMRRGGYIPESLERIAEHVPLITHGLMMGLGGADAFDVDYFRELRRFVHRFETPWHSDHLCFSSFGGRVLHDLLPMPQTEAAARHVSRRVVEARERLEIPMCVENISYYMHLGNPELEETTFLATVLEEADCGLLLDVNNVYVNSQNHGFDPKAWLARIDLDRVMQLHVAGHELRADDGLIIDTHGAPVIDPVYDLLTWTIARTGPRAVILERDNDVPPLPDLLAEWRRVDAAYRRGLAAYQERHPTPAAVPDPRGSDPRPPRETPNLRRQAQTFARETAAQRVLETAVRAPDLDALQRAHEEGFAGLGVAPDDARALQRTDRRRIVIYRKLVRANFLEAIQNQLPRTKSRMGEDAFERYVARFCEDELPASPILRDVAYEFAIWACPHFTADAALPPFLGDLARYELFEFDVYTAVSEPPELAHTELLADAPIAFDGTVRVGTFGYAVHQLPDDPDDATVPAAGEVGVLGYRDRDGRYRQLSLTPLATAILERLLEGTPFAEAVREGCHARETTVDSTVIDGTSKVIADLAERGLVLGSAAHPRPPSPFARWLCRPRFVAPKAIR